MGKWKKRVLSVLLAVFIVFAVLPTYIVPAAAETAFSGAVAGSSPSITYTLTYSKSRVDNTKMKYDFTLTATMSSGGYLLTGALNGKVTVGDGSKDVTIKAKNSTWYQSSTPTKTYTFSVTCSSTSGNTSQSGKFVVTSPDFSSSGIINKSFTVTSSPLLTWTVTYNVSSNGGNVSPASTTVNRGSSVTTPTPTKSYTLTHNANGGAVSPTSSNRPCTCTGWFTTASGSTKRANAGASYTPTQSETIYAQWTNPTMGTLPTPTRTGYYFKGWFTAASGGTQVTSSTTMTGNQTIYAQWTDIPFAIQTLDGEIIDNSKINYRLRLSVQQGAPLVVEAGFNVYVWNGVDFSTLYLTRYWTNEAGIGGSDWSWPLNDALPSNFFVVKAYAKNAAGVIKESENQWGWFQIEAEEYPVTYNANGGSPVPSAQAKYKDVPLTLRPEKPSKTGNSFANWKASNGATYAPGAIYWPNEGTTLTAQWTPNTYTIKYNANGGIGSISDQPVNYDQNVTMPNDGAFIRDGYALAGWSRSSGTPNTKNYEKNASYAVSTLASANNFNCADTNGETMILYAVWTEDTYAITVNGGYANLSRAKAGTEITLTAMPISGYYFKEWQCISGGVTIINNRFVMSAQDVTVNAIFEQLIVTDYPVNVQNDGHGTAYASQTKAAEGTEITLTAMPNNGYSFKEWQIISGSITIIDNKFMMPALDVTIKAVFEPIIYAITAQNDGHGAASASPINAAIGTEITLTATPNNDYHFKEWLVISGGIILADANSANITFFMPANAVTVKASFQENPTTPTHTVTYNYSYNGGSSATKLADTVEEGQAIDLTPTATKTSAGWAFVGWNTSKDATSAWGKTGGLGMDEEPEPPVPLLMGSSDVTLYAIYVKVIGASFIDYSPPGEISYSVSDMYRIYNNATYANASAGAVSISNYPGWTSRGWATDTAADASVALPNHGSTPISTDTAFYSLYQRTLTLSFNADGGSSVPTSQTGTQYTNAYAIDSPTSASFTLPAAISKPGFEFVAWAEGSSDGKQYQPGARITISENTTIYAVWTANIKQFERFAFANTKDDFEVGETTAFLGENNPYLVTLKSYVEELYPDQSYSGLIQNAVDFTNLDGWGNGGGACFGMSVVSILHDRKQINFLNFDSHANSLLQIAKPRNNQNVKSAIYYYHLAQSALSTIGLVFSGSDEWTSAVNELVPDLNVDIGEPILFLYSYDNGKTHAIVITGYEGMDSESNHTFRAYDNRFPNQNFYVILNSSSKTGYTLGDNTRETIEGFQAITSFSIFDKIKVDNAGHRVGSSSLASIDFSNSKVSILSVGITTITNAAGQTLTYNANTQQITGNMNVIHKGLIANETTDGDGAPGQIVFEVADSEKFTISGTEGFRVQVLSNGFYASVEAAGAGVSATLDKKQGISVNGSGQFPFTAALGVNNGAMDLVKVSGSASEKVELNKLEGQGAVISGSANQDLRVQVTSDVTKVDDCSFNSAYNSLLVKKASGELGVYGGAGYSDNILKPKTITKPVANGSTSVTVDYVGSKQLSVTGESVTWSGSNQYVSVGQTGKIASAKNFIKTGSATITASNSAGSVTFNVKVKPTFWQWLMIIFLFGWFWM